MCCDSGVGRCVATILLVAFFSLVLTSCSGGGGGNTTSYTVSASASAGGSISPASVTVNSGATTNFTLTPDSGNSIGSVTGCNGSLLGTTYTTGAINANCTVTASFVSSTLPTVSITDASVIEGDAGTTNLVFTVTLSALASGTVDVGYATSNGSAMAGSDYTATNGTLSILTGNTSGTVTVSITGDAGIESDETFTLTLSNPSGATLGTAVATGTITNDDVPPLPVISVTDTSVTEGDSGTATLSFTITLSTTASGNVDVDYATSDGSATAGSDYTASSGTLTIPAASTSATISTSILGDTNVEGDETLTLALSNPSGNATLGSATATGTILNDDTVGTGTATSPLNDTGITTCSNETTNGLACPQATYPGQDADYGRDAQAAVGTLVKVGGGRAGFDFTKLDSSGNPLADQAAIYTTTPWDCVRDNHTGLVWEVKTTDGGLRDTNYTYTWYNSTGINDGGAPGTSNGGACVDSSNCDTEKYVAAANVTGLCGRNDWRLPSVEELSSLVDSSIANPGPTIDRAYFPNTWFSIYWSSSPNAGDSGNAGFVSFNDGYISVDKESNANNVRLVRGGQ